jgi:hypothetical protein
MLRVSSSVLLAGLLGVAAALLVSCGSSTAKLIPVADAGPLQADFEEVAQAAEAGDGDCSATQTAIAKTEQDFNALPSTVDAGLRATLRQGIDNLRNRALTLCTQPLVQATTSTIPKTTTDTHTATTTPTTTPTSTAPTSTTPTSTTPTTTTPTTTTPGGGVVAPGESAPGTGSGSGSGQGGGTGVGEGAAGESGAGASGAGASANPAAGQEGAK